MPDHPKLLWLISAQVWADMEDAAGELLSFSLDGPQLQVAYAWSTLEAPDNSTTIINIVQQSWLVPHKHAATEMHARAAFTCS